jgi:hypothetical protein
MRKRNPKKMTRKMRPRLSLRRKRRKRRLNMKQWKGLKMSPKSSKISSITRKRTRLLLGRRNQ